MRPALLALLLLLVSPLGGCSADKVIDDAINSIDSVRSTIDTQSKAWRDQLQALSVKLTNLESQAAADSKDVIVSATNQVHDLTEQTISLTDAKVQDLVAQAGVEFRCNADFVRRSVSDALKYLVDDLKFWKGAHKHLDSPPSHGTCWVNPTSLSLYPDGDAWSVDASTMSDKNVIHLFGYQYRPDAMPAVELQDIRGNVVREASIKPAYVTTYQTDLDISGEHFNGVLPGSRLVLRWPDSDDPTTISLVLNPPALLQLTDASITPTSPRAGADPAVLRVTVTNTGGTRSGSYTVNWRPDPTEPTILRKDRSPLNPGEKATISFDSYTYLRSGPVASTVSLNTGDQTVVVPVDVSAAPKVPAPEQDVSGFPVRLTRHGNGVGGFGDDVGLGGRCDPGFVHSRAWVRIRDSRGKVAVSIKPSESDPWKSGDPTDCSTVVHFSITQNIPVNWVTAEVHLTEIGF